MWRSVTRPDESTGGTGRLRRWIGWTMAAILVASVATWYLTRDTLPPVIRIATASEGGLYRRVGSFLGLAS